MLATQALPLTLSPPCALPLNPGYVQEKRHMLNVIDHSEPSHATYILIKALSILPSHDLCSSMVDEWTKMSCRISLMNGWNTEGALDRP